MGARFAKWRAVITIGDGIPSWGCIDANAHALARYAALCQEAGLVPVVEPEVLMDGEHTLEQCCEVTDKVLRTVFSELFAQRVMLEGMILKPNMVLPGSACPNQEDCGRSSRCDGEVSLAGSSRCRSGDCILVRRPIPGAGLGSFKCDECEIQIAATLGVGIFVCPRYPAAGLGALEGPGCQRIGCTAGFVSPRTLQPGCAPRRIRRGNGEEMTGSKHNQEGNSGDSGEPEPWPLLEAHAS